MIRIIGVVLAAVIGAGCATNERPRAVTTYKPDSPEATQKLRDRLVGNWVGEAPLKEGGVRKWLVQRLADGSYMITFIIEPDSGEVERSQEVGLWGVSGPIYFTMTRGWVKGDSIKRVDPTNAYYYDAYRVVSASAQAFEYESFETGNRYRVRKVGDDFSPGDL